MSTVNMQVMRPAQVSLDPAIRKIAIVNRTIPEHKLGNIVEGILTGELPGQDKQGVQKVMEGMVYNLRDSPRVQIVLTSEELKGSGSGSNFPLPLSWDIVENLSRKYQVDAILALETYDSDFIVTNGSKVNKKVTEKGDTIAVNEYFAEGVASVNIGYRLYDPQKKTIVDQATTSDNNTWRAKGTSVQDALAQLIHRTQAIHNVSYSSGLRYGARISPTWYTVSREFYRKPKKDLNFVVGSRKAQVGDWDGAINHWLRVVETGRGKVVGRAAYNLALANEVKGDLSNAKQWAARAYSHYGNRNARQYAVILDQRLWEDQRLSQQLKK